MVCEWGMSDRLGPLSYGRRDEAIFLGRDLGHQRDYSETTANLIDREVREIVENQLNRARDLLKDSQSKLDRLAQQLLEVETLDAEQVERIMSSSDPTSGPAPEEGRDSQMKAA